MLCLQSIGEGFFPARTTLAAFGVSEARVGPARGNFLVGEARADFRISVRTEAEATEACVQAECEPLVHLRSKCGARRMI